MAYSDWNDAHSVDQLAAERLNVTGRFASTGTAGVFGGYYPPLMGPPGTLDDYPADARQAWEEQRRRQTHFGDWRSGDSRETRESRGRYAGRGPKGYARSDARILEDVSERLMWNDELDASDIEVRVENGEVYLSGVVEDRHAKRLAEDLAEDVPGVKDVHVNLKIRHGFLASLTGEKAETAEDGRDVARSNDAWTTTRR